MSTHDDEVDDDGEVLTPDQVSGPDDEAPDPLERPARPDRRALWALIAGLAAVWFAFLGSILAIILVPVAIILSRRAMRAVDAGDLDPRERRKAKIGLIAGILAGIFIVVQLTFVALFFEWDKTDDLDLEPTDKSGAPTTTIEEPG